MWPGYGAGETLWTGIDGSAMVYSNSEVLGVPSLLAIAARRPQSVIYIFV